MANEDVDMSVAEYLEKRFEGYDDDFDDDLDCESDIGLGYDEEYHGHQSVITNPQISAGSNACSVCYEQRDDLTIMSPCQHRYCVSCLRQSFRVAMEDETRYPPRCCVLTTFSLQLTGQVLDAQELQAFHERAEEMRTSQRLYCAVPSCSRFIPSAAIDNEHGTCAGCEQRTHTVCKNLEHPGRACPSDAGVDGVLQMASAEGWRRCARCRTVVERTGGCDDFICHCGYRFCWGCGKPPGRCSCLGPGEMGHREDQAFEQLAADPREDDDDDYLHFDRMIELAGVEHNLLGVLRDFGFDDPLPARGCPDGSHTQWNMRREGGLEGGLECGICRAVMPHFIFECDACGLRACFDCRRSL